MDESEHAVILGRSDSAVVVQCPGRKFPGIVLQGDTLKILADLADEIIKTLAEGDLAEVNDAAEELRESLRGRLAVYEEICSSRGISLPY